MPTRTLLYAVFAALSTATAQQSAPACTAVTETSGTAEILDAVAASPDCVFRGGGARAVHVLGRRYLAETDTVAALDVWSAGLELIDPLDGGPRDELVGDYLTLIGQIGQDRWPRPLIAVEDLLYPSEEPVIDGSTYAQVLAQLDTVIPDSVRARVFVDGRWKRGVAASASDALAEWWVAVDPFPATGVNERWVEHVVRVGRALQAYAEAGQATGYGVRGDLFVRFGAPRYVVPVSFEEPDLLFAMSRENVGLSLNSFPRGEVWLYQDLDTTMWYLLKLDNGVYRRARSADMLPQSLRNTTGNDPRKDQLRRIALLAMRHLYDKLATISMDHGRAWGEVSSAVNGTMSPYANPGAPTRIQRDVNVNEVEIESRRAREEPPSETLLLRDTPAAPYAGSVSRFPTEGGGTRLELTWQLQAESVLSTRPYHVLVGSVITDARTLDRETIAEVSQPLTASQLRTGIGVPTVTESVPCTRDGCTATVQLDLYATSREDDPRGELVGVSVWDVDPQDLLPTSGLVISDLQPVDPLTREPIARSAVLPGTPLSLYFETRGFQGGQLGRSRVSVEYEVTRRRRNAFVSRTVGTPTSDELKLFIRGTSTEQYLILETTDWTEADTVTVLVRVRDEQSGRAVERTRTFEVAR